MHAECTLGPVQVLASDVNKARPLKAKAKAKDQHHCYWHINPNHGRQLGTIMSIKRSFKARVKPLKTGAEETDVCQSLPINTKRVCILYETHAKQ